MAMFVAIQPWLNLIGLGMDFIGLLLLANEWRIALAAERREAEIAEREMMMRPRPMPGRRENENPHQSIYDDMRERQKHQARQLRGYTARAARRRWFAIALALVGGGFLLQIAGSVPL